MISSASPSSASPQPTAASLPLDTRPDDLDELVRALRSCSPSDLRRARRHHRRALTALTDGCYDALSDETRRQLIRRLREDLTALNRALAATSTRPTDDAPRPPDRSSGLWGFLSEWWP
jgi:uncharacterized membrane protein YccC